MVGLGMKLLSYTIRCVYQKQIINLLTKAQLEGRSCYKLKMSSCVNKQKKNLSLFRNLEHFIYNFNIVFRLSPYQIFSKSKKVKKRYLLIGLFFFLEIFPVCLKYIGRGLVAEYLFLLFFKFVFLSSNSEASRVKQGTIMAMPITFEIFQLNR